MSTEEPFIWTHYLSSDLTTQNSSHRAVGRGGASSHFISPVCVWGGGRQRKEGGGGQETKGHPRIIRIAGKTQTIHTWSDRASNYFLSGKDDIKLGSIPGDTVHALVNLSRCWLCMASLAARCDGWEMDVAK